MIRTKFLPILVLLSFCGQAFAPGVGGAERPVSERFAQQAASEDAPPSFQRHVMPLLGRLGCNGRACHGSFQGQGGFRLSLFGYDFATDHAALLEADSGRVNTAAPLESLILNKPTSEDDHGGGKRFDVGSWEYQLLRRWIESGAEFKEDEVQHLVALEVTPREIIFQRPGQQVQLNAVAVWEDGSRENVTPLCRFQTNDSHIADVDDSGRVTGENAGDSHIVVFYDKAVVPVPVMRPLSDLTGERYPEVSARTVVDELVVRKLRKLGVQPSELCTDAEFLRRVRLDLTGTLPTPHEVEQFLADPDPEKRSKKIDELLESPAYAAWWATRLCDFTGNNPDQTLNSAVLRGEAGRQWYEWIERRVAENVPYDKLVEGIVLAKSREEGESYYEYCRAMSEITRPTSDASMADRQYMPYFWARQDFRRAPERAISFAYAFLGVRIECAQCHKHPFDQWSKQDFDEFAKFFGDVKVGRHAPDAREAYEKLVSALGLEGRAPNGQRLSEALTEGQVVPFGEVFVEPPAAKRPRQGGRKMPKRKAVLLGGQTINLNAFHDAREPLMEWLRSPSNPYFAKAFVNRVWAAYMGVGIVEPPDDLSLANPPSNPELLDYLAQGFIASGFDMKWVHREILRSDTYQRSWRPNPTNELDKRNFSRALLRRLPAEVVVDAVQQATASDAQVAAMQTDMSQRAILLAGTGIRGNEDRDTNYALNVFGRSTRENNCDCDRSMTPTLLQTVYLQNDPNVLELIQKPDDGWLAQVRQQLDGLLSIASSGDVEAIRELKRRRAAIERQMNLQEFLEGSERLPQLERQLARINRELTRINFVIAEACDQLIRQAYLRTVSRYPTDEELAVSREYIEQAPDTVSGLGDLLWALINTKEFIVNH